MQKLKKWTALFCAVAALITLLVPMNSLAAEEQGTPAAAAGEARAEQRAESYLIVKNEQDAVLSSNLEGSTEENPVADAVVLVSNADLTIEFEVEGESAASYTWRRQAPSGSVGTGILPGETASSYIASLDKGDFAAVGAYTYTCDLYDAAGTVTHSVRFRLEALGTGLSYVNADSAAVPAKLVTEVTPGDTDMLLEAQLDAAAISDMASRINAGDNTLATPDNRGRGVFEWTSAELGERFDQFPYDKPDNAGAWYDSQTNRAWFQLAVAYDDGATYASQVAGGVNHYTVTARGRGIDPARSSLTFTRTVIPQLKAAPEAAAGYSVEQISDNEVTYTYGTTDLSVTGRLMAAWQMSLVPASAQYVWTRTEAGQTSSETTDARALDFTIDSPANTEAVFVVTPTGPAFQNLTPEQTAQVSVTYTVRVDKSFADPVINGFSATLNNGRPVTVSPSTSANTYEVTIARGNDLILNVDADPGSGVGGVLTCSWELFNTVSGQATPITDSTEGFVLEDDGTVLRIINVQLDLDQNILRSTATNRGGKKTTRGIKINLDMPVQPRVRLTSEPQAAGSMLEVQEGAQIDLIVEETNGISAASLSYRWMATTARDHEDASAWQEVASGTDNPYSFAAARTLNDVLTYYKCIVTNTSGRASSPLEAQTGEIVIKVVPAKGVITVDEPKQDVEHRVVQGEGGDLKFDVIASIDSGSELAYQWYMMKTEPDVEVIMEETNAIPGATETTYRPGRYGDDGYYVYKCKIYNPADQVEWVWSPEFQVTVVESDAVPVVTIVGDTTQGASVGEYVRMRAKAYSPSGEPVAYQWEVLTGDGWQDVPDAAGPSLTVSNLQVSQSGTQYRCRVTNLRQNLSVNSKVFTVLVWQTGDMPVIVTQPEGWTLQSGTAEAAHPVLRTAVQIAGNNSYKFNWQTWDDEAQQWVSVKDLDQFDVNTADTASSELEFVGSTDQYDGRYRCEIVNRGGSPAGATVYTNEVEVRIMLRSVPTILSAPRSQNAMVGKTVTLRVNAVIHPSEPLTYTWRVQEPGSSSWRNCDDSDGSGYDTPVFTTRTYTESDSNQQFRYRCVVEGSLTHVQAPANTTATIQVYPEYPQLDVAPTSKLTIKEDVDTGERYLRGYRASRDGLMLTVKGVYEDVIAQNLTGSGRRYTLEVRDKNGNLLRSEDDRITTGCTVTLLLTDEPGAEGAPVTADELTIIVQGDVQGTGRMSIGQLVSMANYLVGDVVMTGTAKEAADINGNGKCDIGDLTIAAQLMQ